MIPDLTRWRRADDAVVARGDGLYLRTDPHDSLGLVAHGRYEPFETALLLSLAEPGSVVIDIGSNVGYHTVQFARAVGPTGHVLAFEPDPDNARLLEHNVRTNALDQVTVVGQAAADRCGTARLFRSADNLGDHRLFDPDGVREAIVVDTVAVDDVFDRLIDAGCSVSVIKLDVQGAEPLALGGLTRTIARHPEAWIATEFFPAGLAQAGSSPAAYLDDLRAFAGTLLRIDEGHRRLVPLDLDWLAETVTVERQNHTNLLVPRRDWVPGSAPSVRSRRS